MRERGPQRGAKRNCEASQGTATPTGRGKRIARRTALPGGALPLAEAFCPPPASKAAPGGPE